MNALNYFVVLLIIVANCGNIKAQVTPAPVTPAPVTTAPVTPAPVTPGPVTPAPVTTAPVTTAPVTPGPVTPGPVTPAPVTPGPVTPAPVTPGPVTPAPVTPAPVTPTPKPTPTPTPAPVCEVTPAKCYRNVNGYCRYFRTPCDVKNANSCSVPNPKMQWAATNILDCKGFDFNQIKVCATDCPKFVTADCVSRPENPICVTSDKMKKRRLMRNVCAAKKNACATNTDWRPNNMTICQGLKVNAPAVAW